MMKPCVFHSKYCACQYCTVCGSDSPCSDCIKENKPYRSRPLCGRFEGEDPYADEKVIWFGAPPKEKTIKDDFMPYVFEIFHKYQMDCNDKNVIFNLLAIVQS